MANSDGKSSCNKSIALSRVVVFGLVAALILLSLAFPLYAEGDPAPILLHNAHVSFLKSDYRGSLKFLRECLTAAEKKGDRVTSADARLLKARLLLELQFYDKAYDEALMALRDCEALKKEDGIFSCHTVCIESLLKRNRVAAAWKNLRLLEKGLSTVTSRAALVDFYLLRGFMLMEQDNLDLAEKNFTEAAKLAQGMKDCHRSGLAAYHQIQLHIQKKKFSKAIELCARAIVEAEESESPYLVGVLQRAAAKCKHEEGQHDEALIISSGAFKIFQLCGNPGAAGLALEQTAGFYLLRGQMDLSRATLRKAWALYAENDHHFLAMKCCSRIIASDLSPVDKEDHHKYGALMHKEAAQTGDPFDRAWAEEKEGDTYSSLNQDKAFQAYARASNLYSGAHDKPGELRTLIKKGDSLFRMSRLDEAMDCFQSALPLSVEADQQGSRDDISFVYQYSPGAINRKAGTACLTSERCHDALGYFEKALTYDSAEDRTLLRINDRQGIIIVSIYAYDLERARREVAKALEEASAMKEPYERASGYNMVINGLLNSSMSMGSTKGYDRLYSNSDTLTADLVKTIYDDPRLYRQMQEGYREWIAQGKDRKSLIEQGIPYMLLGFFYFAGGKTAEAHDAMGLSIELFSRAKMPMLTGIMHFLLGMNYVQEGRKEEAKKSIEESLKQFTLQGDKKNLASIGGYLGLLCRDMGNLDESLAWYEKALRTARETGNRRSISYVLVGMGYTYYEMKRYNDAEKCYKDALSLQEESDNRKERALTCLFMGRMEESRQDQKRALDYYTLALKGFESLGKVFDVRDAALEMGALYEKNGKDTEALQVYLEALGGLIEVRSRLGEKYLAGSRSDLTKRLFERTVSLLIKAGRYDEALKYFGLSGSYDLFSGVDLAAIEVKDARLGKLVEEMGTLSRKMKLLQNELESGQSQGRKQFLTGELASTKQQFLAVTNEIKDKNPDYGQMIAIQSPELAQLQPVIPADTLLLQYYPSEEGLYIFVVSKENFAIKRVEVTRSRLYELIKDLRSQLEKPGGEGSDLYKKTRAQLYGFLLKPVMAEIERKEEIEIIPAGLLWYVPFEILGDQERVSLVDRKAVGYLYSSNIVSMLAARKKGSAGESRLVAFGNPEGADLPASGDEVTRIGGLFPSSLVFTGREATKEAFREKAPLATYLHIATHSILKRDDINNSYIQFAGDRGHFSLGEIYGLSLPEAQLVVLSSCESALGSENPGREFASLASAFTVAGAPSVIASLWKVDDVSTALLFTEFYGNLKKGYGKAESLRRARLAMKEKSTTASPHYWSSFILLGDWR